VKLRKEVDALKVDHVQAMKTLETVFESRAADFQKIIEDMADENIEQVNTIAYRLAEAERDLDIKCSELAWYEEDQGEEEIDDEVDTKSCMTFKIDTPPPPCEDDSPSDDV
jgi:hypothetical protein